MPHKLNVNQCTLPASELLIESPVVVFIKY